MTSSNPPPSQEALEARSTPPALEPPKPILRAITLALLVLLVLSAIVSVLSFNRKVAAFQSAGIEVTPDSSGWKVEEVYGASTLEPGDIVIQVEGQLVGTESELRRLLSSDHITSVVFLRGEDLQEGTHRRPPLRIDFSYLVLALIGVAYLFIGLYTLLRGVTRQVTLFVLWCTCSALLYLVSPQIPPPDRLGLLLYLIEEFSRALLPPLTLHFFLIFPRPLQVGAQRTVFRRFVAAIYLPAAVLMAVHFDLALGLGRLVKNPTESLVLLLDRAGLLMMVGAALMALVALIAQGRNSEGWEERRQILWIAAGMAAGYVPFLGLYVAPLSLRLPTPELLQVVGVLPLALVPLGFAWALLRYRLWDVAIILRNATTYAVTLLVGALAFSLLRLLINNQIPIEQEWTRNLSTIAGGLLVAGLLVPTKQSIGAALERFQYRGAFARRRSLADLGEELLYERDLERLCANLTKQLEETMNLERCNLYLLRDDEFHPVTPESLTTNFFLPQEAIGERFWQLDWIRIEQQSLPTLDPDIEDELFSFGYRTAFPLKVRERPVGVLATGYRSGHSPLTSADSMLIRQILNQAALAIENARLLEQMQDRLRQVSELQRFNEEIIESSPAGIAVLNDRDRIVHSNLAFSDLVKRGREAMRDAPIQEVLPIDLPSPESGILETTLPSANIEPHSSVTESGQFTRGKRHVQVSLARLHGSSANGTRVLVVNDVTELTKMERALQEKERLAALGVMAAGVAHEVNTPLTGISSYAQMLLQDTDPSDPRFAMLQKVERQTFRASRIVGNLLELSRSSGPQQDPVELRPVIEESIDLLRPRFEKNHIVVELLEPWPQDLVVGGDEGELLQVINNLLLNAAEATLEVASSGSFSLSEEQPGVVEVRAEITERRVKIDVLDQGLGIAEADLPKIFRPFFSTKLDRGGTGLGLSISYEIIRRHGGELRATNRKPRGCRLSIHLPQFAPTTKTTAGGHSELTH